MYSPVICHVARTTLTQTRIEKNLLQNYITYHESKTEKKKDTVK